MTSRLDVASLMGVGIALGALLLGQLLEGGSVAALLQGTAALIVFGGTAGATLLSVPARDARRALRMFGRVFAPEILEPSELVDQFGRLAIAARRDGIVSLEERVRTAPDPFLKRAIRHVVDGAGSDHLRDVLETELVTRSSEGQAAARVFEIAAGYAPTIGILGAVLGLIHAMQHLSDPSQLGSGIAVAFVATVYGVGSANLFLHPVAAKLDQLVELRRVHDEMVMEGALALQSGAHPGAMRSRLRAYLGEADRSDDA